MGALALGVAAAMAAPCAAPMPIDEFMTPRLFAICMPAVLAWRIMALSVEVSWLTRAPISFSGIHVFAVAMTSPRRMVHHSLSIVYRQRGKKRAALFPARPQGFRERVLVDGVTSQKQCYRMPIFIRMQSDKSPQTAHCAPAPPLPFQACPPGCRDQPDRLAACRAQCGAVAHS